MIPVQRPGAGELVNAVANCDIVRAKTLIERGADPDAIDVVSNERVLVTAIMSEYSGELTKLLIESGAEYEARDNYGLTPLMYAASYNNPLALAVLIGKGVALDEKDPDGETALEKANAYGFGEIAEMLKKALRERQMQAEKRASDAAAAEQTRIATLRDTAARKQANLRKHMSGMKLQ